MIFFFRVPLKVFFSFLSMKVISFIDVSSPSTNDNLREISFVLYFSVLILKTLNDHWIYHNCNAVNEIYVI